MKGRGGYPGDDRLLRRGLRATIVGAAALHDRVRDGNGWDDRAQTTRIPPGQEPGVKRDVGGTARSSERGGGRGEESGREHGLAAAVTRCARAASPTGDLPAALPACAGGGLILG